MTCGDTWRWNAISLRTATLQGMEEKLRSDLPTEPHTQLEYRQADAESTACLRRFPGSEAAAGPKDEEHAISSKRGC